MYNFPLEDMRFFQAFGKEHVRSADGKPLNSDSAEFKQNAKATNRLALEFNKRAELQIHNYKDKTSLQLSSMLFTGGIEYAIMAVNADVVLKILNSMQKDGLIDEIKEISADHSWAKVLNNSKFTPH